MEAYYLTGDENYTDYANRWGSNNIYNGSTWNTKGDNSRIGKYFPDNHTSFQTYLDMFSITANKKFDPNDEKIKNVVPIMNEMEQMDINDLKTKKGYWDRIDFFYMELPNWTKMYLLTGEEKWLDKLRELYNDRKAELYDEETGLFYRDKNYIFDPNAQYNPNGDGNNQKISPNGKKILWSRGNGWAMAALTKILQDLPDSREDDRKEYEAVFKKMAATLVEVQGDDGFWRMNLDDYNHDTRLETSGTVFFAYGLTWGINNGLLDKEIYYPAVKKAFLGLNANAIRPDGLVGRSELISAYPNPKCSLGIGSSQSYAPAATVMFLSELSKLVEQGYVTNDVEPTLNKKMISAVAVKEDSKYAVVNSQIRELVSGTDLTTIKKDNKIYVPEQFIEEVYGQDIIDKITDLITIENTAYLSLNEFNQIIGNLKLSTVKNNITIISYKTNLFNSSIDSKLIDLLDIGLTEGKYPKRPEYPIRFDYTKPADELKPSKDALVSVAANTSGGVSASRLIGPNTNNLVNIEFDMVTTLSPLQTNAIVGIGSSTSDYTSYSQVPIIIRMYKDGKLGAYNGKGYVQSNVEFEKNKKYHLCVSINLEDKTYDVYATPQQQEEIQIAKDYAFRATAKAPEDIGKIYLFNNDQQAGKYWLEDIYLEAQATDKTALKIALDLANAITDKDLEKVIPAVVEEFKAARDEANVVYNNASALQVEVNKAFDRLVSIMQKLEFFKGDKTALKTFIDKVNDLDSNKYTQVTWIPLNEALTAATVVYNDENAMQEEVNNAYKELVTAFLDLRLKPNKDLLEDLINKAENINTASYTAETVRILNSALEDATVVLNNENVDQKVVNEAYVMLNNAFEGLVAVNSGNPTTPNLPINSAAPNDSQVNVKLGDTTVSAKTGEAADFTCVTPLCASIAALAYLAVSKKRKED